MSYLELLNKLVALGANLPKLLPILLQIVELIQQALVILGLGPKLMGESHADVGLTAAEVEAEGKVSALCGEVEPQKFGRIGDGSIIEVIRNVWAFIQASPQLMQLVQMLLALWLKAAKPA